MPIKKKKRAKTLEASVPIKNNIRALRFRRGEMTQADLAKRVGLTRQTIISIEQGQKSPSLDVAFKIAQALKVPFDEAFQFKE